MMRLKVAHGGDGDLRVAGQDDHPLSRYACPPLTTVALNYNEIGRRAIELLLHKLGDAPSVSSFGGMEERAADIMLRSSA